MAERSRASSNTRNPLRPSGCWQICRLDTPARLDPRQEDAIGLHVPRVRFTQRRKKDESTTTEDSCFGRCRFGAADRCCLLETRHERCFPQNPSGASPRTGRSSRMSASARTATRTRLLCPAKFIPRKPRTKATRVLGLSRTPRPAGSSSMKFPCSQLALSRRLKQWPRTLMTGSRTTIKPR